MNLRRLLLVLPLLAAGTTTAVTAAAPRALDSTPPVTRAYLTGPDGTSAAGQISYPGPVRVRLEAVDLGSAGLASTRYRVDHGPWRRYRLPAPEVLFDGTRASFARWQHVGLGTFVLQPHGTMRTSGEFGMLWWPERQWGSAEFHLRWRVVPSAGNQGNSGVLIRFPDPNAVTDGQPCRGIGYGLAGLADPAYSSVSCGNEVQVNDFSAADPQRTGSVYDFSFLHDPQQRPVKPGVWTDYVVRVVGGAEYAVTVLRDGHVINEWVNTPGQLGWRSGCYCGAPLEGPGDAPSDLRQFARGYFGLQNHSSSDVVEYGRVTAQDLSGEAGAFTVTGAGGHLLEISSTDRAGNVEPVQQVRFTIGAASGFLLTQPHGCSLGSDTPSTTRTTCSYVATSALGQYDARTSTVWSVRVRRGRATWLAAGHASAPSLSTSGTFPTQPGDEVTVTFGPDLTTPRDDNVALAGAVGSITVGDWTGG